MIEEADYVIAGAGSAGCVLARRLSDNGRDRVVLLEAGPPSDRFWVNMPAGVVKLMSRTDLNWLYSTEPDPTLKGRSLLWFAGKMVGGGSAINGMVYTRGTTYDYDGWAAMGCTGWSWDDVFPYFLRSENFTGPKSETHGQGGPLTVSPLTIIHPLTEPFLAACGEVGLRRIEDYCAGDIDGAYINFATQKNGERWSTARGFLQPVSGRSNLRVVTGALVDRVILDGRRAVGLRYRHDGVDREIRARGEVIVCSGAMQSPPILMRSGIGPGAHLREHGIPVVVDSPEVGKNLCEHPDIAVSRLVDVPTYNMINNPFRLAWEAAGYLLAGRGMLTTCTVHAQAHGRTSPERNHPDIKVQLLPAWFVPPEAAESGMTLPDAGKQAGVSLTVELMDARSRGEIRLRSTDPGDAPIIDYPIYGDPSDLERMRQAVRFADRIFDAPSLRKHVVGPAFPPDINLSDDALDELLRAHTRVGSHPASSCRMGGDEGSVVDPLLRVRGIERLRVADASIMPALPSANTNAPSIMIGERAANFIKAEQLMH